MRTLGPRSVSSFLKILLDIAFVLLCIAALWLGFRTAVSVIGLANPALFEGWESPFSGRPMAARTPRGAALLMTISLQILISIFIVGRLRGIFRTLIAGAPFEIENARRLRLIGLALGGLEATRYITWLTLTYMFDTPARFMRPDFSVTGWFSIAVLFVLAEVFEEGVRLRRESELTI